MHFKLQSINTYSGLINTILVLIEMSNLETFQGDGETYIYIKEEPKLDLEESGHFEGFGSSKNLEGIQIKEEMDRTEESLPSTAEERECDSSYTHCKMEDELDILEEVDPVCYACHHCRMKFILFKDLKIHVQKCFQINLRMSMMENFSILRGKEHLLPSQFSSAGWKNVATVDLKKLEEKSYNFNKVDNKYEGTKKLFAVNSNLVTPKRIRSGEKLLRCDECGKAFKQNSDLIKHKRTHTGEKPFRCEECDIGFTMNCHLIRHRRIHSDEKPFSCMECGKEFRQNCDLIRHMRTHSGEKPYTCNECGKGFTQSYSLIKHTRIHSGEKPFKCEECGKMFRQNSALICHKKTHNKKKTKCCKECGEGFKSNNSLKIHKRIHSGDKREKCQT